MKQRGFTLVEVMISLVISSLLIGMILSLFVRMSTAYRGQQGVAELQQILSAAHGLMETDLRQAGFQMPDGFWVASDQDLHQAVEIRNDADGFGPDAFRVYYADTSAQARVVDFNGTADSSTAAFTTLTVDDNGDFVAGDLAVIVKSTSGAPADVRFYTCVVQIATLGGSTQINLSAAAPFGSSTNDQCDQVRTGDDGAPSGDDRAMVYRFRARGYRNDPNRRDLAVLQVSPTAGLVNDWQDPPVGLTDLQVASRWDDTKDPVEVSLDTVDADNDATREWYSDVTQETKSQPVVATIIGHDPYRRGAYNDARSRLIAMRVSLVVRTHAKIASTPTARTPAFIDAARPGNNDLGDRDAIQLEGLPDASKPPERGGWNI